MTILSGLKLSGITFLILFNSCMCVREQQFEEDDFIVDSRATMNDLSHRLTHREPPKYPGTRDLLGQRGMPAAEANGSFVEIDMGPAETPSCWNQKVEIGRPLGRGAFGQTWKFKITCPHEGYPNDAVAVKVISGLRTEEDRKNVADEVRVLKEMKGVSDYVNAFVGRPPAVEFEGQQYLMLPMMNNGDFDSFLSSRLPFTRRGLLKSDARPLVLSLFFHVVKGVQALHAKDLVHLDLKPDNAMVNCEPYNSFNCYAAVIDLGFAGHIGTGGDVRGTPGHAAPEIGRGTFPDTPNDIFSLGVMLYKLVFNQGPFDHLGASPNLFRKTMEQDVDIDQPILNIDANAKRGWRKIFGAEMDNGYWETFLESAVVLIKSMMKKDPALRPDVGSVLTDLRALIDLAKPCDTENRYTEHVDKMLAGDSPDAPTKQGLKYPLPPCLDTTKSWFGGDLGLTSKCTLAPGA